MNFEKYLEDSKEYFGEHFKLASGLSEEQVIQIFDAIKNNTKIKHLSLISTQFTFKVIDTLKQILCANNNIKKLSLIGFDRVKNDNYMILASLKRVLAPEVGLEEVEIANPGSYLMTSHGAVFHIIDVFLPYLSNGVTALKRIHLGGQFQLNRVHAGYFLKQLKLNKILEQVNIEGCQLSSGFIKHMQ